MPQSNPKTDPVIAIGTLAEKTGLSVSAIRKYEAEGLLIAHRTAAGHRMFSLEDIIRVRVIRKMIQELGLNMEGIRRLQAFLPCWEMVDCPTERRDDCAAYLDSSKPCWMIKSGECREKGNECRDCVVYRFGSQCAEDIKQLVYLRADTRTVAKQARRILLRSDQGGE